MCGLRPCHNKACESQKPPNGRWRGSHVLEELQISVPRELNNWRPSQSIDSSGKLTNNDALSKSAEDLRIQRLWLWRSQGF